MTSLHRRQIVIAGALGACAALGSSRAWAQGGGTLRASDTEKRPTMKNTSAMSASVAPYVTPIVVCPANAAGSFACSAAPIARAAASRAAATDPDCT